MDGGSLKNLKSEDTYGKTITSEDIDPVFCPPTLLTTALRRAVEQHKCGSRATQVSRKWNASVAREPCKCCTNGVTAPHCSICTGTSLFVNE